MYPSASGPPLFGLIVTNIVRANVYVWVCTCVCVCVCVYVNFFMNTYICIYVYMYLFCVIRASVCLVTKKIKRAHAYQKSTRSHMHCRK